MPKTLLYLVRHGSTKFNEGARFRGSSTVPLSELGQQQAKTVHSFLETKPIAAIYTSPRPRAVETAQIIAAGHKDTAGADLTPVEDKRLDSVFYGSWEGKTQEEVEKEDPENFKIFREHISQLDMGGEHLSDLAHRVSESLIEACEANPGKEIVAVTHQVCTRTIICHLLNSPLDNYWQIGQDPACINVLEYIGHGKFNLRVMNFLPNILDIVEKESKAW